MERDSMDKLGSILKAARKSNEFTREQFAEIINITPRYLMSIENENKKPSYDVLFRVVRKLGISADTIFYPEQEKKISELEYINNLLCLCDEYQVSVVKATLHALLRPQNIKHIK